MFHKFCSTCIQYFRPLFLFAFAILQAAGLHAHQDRMNAQIRDQGLFLAARPAKISIKLPDQPVLAGSKPQLAIALWKADNSAAEPTADWECKVSIQFRPGSPSRKLF
jgi:hypothetical protein